MWNWPETLACRRVVPLATSCYNTTFIYILYTYCNEEQIASLSWKCESEHPTQMLKYQLCQDFQQSCSCWWFFTYPGYLLHLFFQPLFNHQTGGHHWRRTHQAAWIWVVKRISLDLGGWVSVVSWKKQQSVNICKNRPMKIWIWHHSLFQ